MLGTDVITIVNKQVNYNDKKIVIPKGTRGIVCDIEHLKEGNVFIEIVGYYDAFGYSVDELEIVKRPML